MKGDHLSTKWMSTVKNTHTAMAVEDIHNYAKKIAWAKRRLAALPQGDIGIRFIDKLNLVGLSDARLCYYGDRVPRLLGEFEKLGVKLKNAKKKDCEAVLSTLLSQKYKGETKCAFAVTLLRLVRFAKKNEIDDKKRGYAKEVAWISPTRSKDKNQGIQPKDLLTIEELKAIINQATNKRSTLYLDWLSLLDLINMESTDKNQIFSISSRGRELYLAKFCDKSNMRNQ